MTAAKQNTPPQYSGPINTTERRLVLYEPPAHFSPPHREEKISRRRAHRFSSFLCAVLCILTVTLIALNTAILSKRIHLDAIVLRLGSHALFGIASVSVTPPEENVLTLPPDAMDTTPSEPGEIPPVNQAETAPAVPILPKYAILPADISSADIHTLNNETTYAPDTKALLADSLPFSDLNAHMETYGADSPYVLILHTHGTESFTKEGTDTYTTADAFRTEDISENIVAVGAVMAETLKAAGIPVLHCTEMFDKESYQESYSRAAAAIRGYLEQYPSIKIVLDVHRDSVIRADMTKIRPVTKADGKDTAQFMIVTGTDFKGANHPDWTKNLNFAMKIQKNAAERTDRFVRSVNLRGAGFNQQYTAGSLIFEIGACGNTLTEAKRAGVLAAIAVAETVSGRDYPLPLGHILP